MEITCENEGCSAVVKLDHLSAHHIECEFSPNVYFQCENGCEQSISKEERLVTREEKKRRFSIVYLILFFFFFFQTHNCVQTLRHELNTMKIELDKYKNDVDFYKNQVCTLRKFLRTIHFDRIENDEILR